MSKVFAIADISVKYVTSEARCEADTSDVDPPFLTALAQIGQIRTKVGSIRVSSKMLQLLRRCYKVLEAIERSFCVLAGKVGVIHGFRPEEIETMLQNLEYIADMFSSTSKSISWILASERKGKIPALYTVLAMASRKSTLHTPSESPIHKSAGPQARTNPLTINDSSFIHTVESLSHHGSNLMKIPAKKPSLQASRYTVLFK
ncbi:hypothetical protein E6O75_ATG01561 [Venturia nashicola]|uniref:Uncharacterized protein n=1 Tax=Venturia nashicola TaxID=86259 RepID=A0A4Z1PCG1_9PEZI|nr:hypothetical protein E6O75_ATG01561 [Venturia nashicola]